MATTSARSIVLGFTGDVTLAETFAAAANANSPAQVQILTLAPGANTISVPTGGTAPTAVLIIPPSGNTQLMTLKGVTGDTGVPIHKTDPTNIALDSTCASLVLNAAGTVTGLRLIWS